MTFLLLLLLLIASPVLADQTKATDNFNRTDENPLTTPWTTITDQAALQIVSQMLRTSATAADTGAYHSQSLGNDQWAQATLVTMPSTGAFSRTAGPTIRTSTTTETFYAGSASRDSDGSIQYRIIKFVSGAVTELASAGTPTANDVVRVEASGQNIRLLVNGTLLISVNDTSIASGQAGMFIYVGSGAVGDYEWDNWSAGDYDWQSIGTLGSTQSSTANQSSLALTTSAACESGNVCACVVTVDNNGTTDGDEGAVTSITDSASNTWSEVIEFANGQGTAQTGAVAYLGYTKATTTIASSGTITANFSNSTSRDASAMTCWEYSVRSGYTVSSAGTTTLATDGADPGAISLSSLTSTEYLFLHGLAAEGPNTDAYTWDTDYTQFAANGTSAATGLTQTRDPTADEAESGTWSGATSTTRYTLVDDHPDTTCSAGDRITAGTAASEKTFTGSALSVPTGSTNISIQVLYYDGKTASQGTTVRARLKVNGTYYNNGTTHNPANGGCTSRSDSWTTNPNTSAAWTVADVNGTGSNPLQAFGFGCSDCSPTVYFGSIRLQVTYDEPADGAMHVRGGFRIFVGTGDTVDVTSTTADRDYAQVFAALLASAPSGGTPFRGLTLLGVGQ